MTRRDALLTWLQLEREAVWFYALVGARFDDLEERARRSLGAHRSVRDDLLTRVDDDTTTARATYPTGPLDDAEQATAAARSLEQRVQAACLQVVRTFTGRGRRVGLDGLTRAATAELTWGGEPRAFPGLD